MQHEVAHPAWVPRLLGLKTGRLKPAGDFGGGPGTGLAEETEEPVQESPELPNLAGRIRFSLPRLTRARRLRAIPWARLCIDDQRRAG